MLESTLTEEYIKDIPWSRNPALAFEDDADKYAEAFKNVLQITPDSEKKISFSDYFWDFRPYFEDINSDTYLIRFKNADDDYVDYLKFYTVYAIGRKKKISTLDRQIQDIITIISSIKKSTNHKTFSLITTDDIVDEIEGRDVGSGRYYLMYSSMYQVYNFIQKNYADDFPVNIDVLSEKALHYKKESKSENNRIPNIPEEYYNLIIKKADEVLNDETQPLNSRMTAGLIIIATQTGLRRQDLVGLKTDALMEKILPVSGVKSYYLHYQSRKPSKSSDDLLEFDIYGSDLCAQTFIKMKEIREESEFSSKPYLYVLSKSSRSTNTYPVPSNRLNREYLSFYFHYLYDETQREWDGITGIVYEIGRTNRRYTLNVPSIAQYRVHLATSLYNNGIPLAFIQRYLGHLSEYMLGYYVRTTDPANENAEYAERIVKKITVNNQTPIGHMGKELKDNLMKFIEDGHYNVSTDTKQILEDLGEKLVIREKGAGLCCIKTSIIPCKNDARTNEILCAYGMCPNIFHFYDAIDVTYMQFHALQEAYQQNLDNGFERAAQKELNKMKDFIRRRLAPEFKELERVVNEAGADDFCFKHPDLAAIVKNIPQIKEEIRLWENY